MADISLLINGFRSQLVKDGDMLDIPDICELLEAELLGVVLEDEAIIVCRKEAGVAWYAGHGTACRQRTPYRFRKLLSEYRKTDYRRGC